MYERFSIYVNAQTLKALEAILTEAADEYYADPVHSDLANFRNEVRARIQHLPDGIERKKVEDDDWLG